MIGEKKRNICDDLWWHCGPMTYRTQSLLLVSCTHRNCNDNLYENEKYSWLPAGNDVLNWKPIHFYQIKAYKMHHSLATQWFNTMDRRNGNCPFHRCFPALNLTILTLNTTDGDIKHKTQSREPHRWLEGWGWPLCWCQDQDMKNRSHDAIFRKIPGKTSQFNI